MKDNRLRELLKRAKDVKKTTFAYIARRTGQSPQNLNGKLSRGTLSISELTEIADILGVDIVLIDRKTGYKI